MSFDFVEEGEEIEASPENDLFLGVGQCWIADPDYLWHDSGVEGVLAIQMTEGGLFYLDGETRKWVNVETAGRKGLKSIN